MYRGLAYTVVLFTYFAEKCADFMRLQRCNVENGKFLCADRRQCLSTDEVCDGKKDCRDGTDEFEFCLASNGPCGSKVTLLFVLHCAVSSELIEA